MTLVEGQFGHGGIRPNPIKHWIGKQLIPRAQAQAFFDWDKGVDNTQGIKIKNQQTSFSCGGQALSYILEILEKKEPLSAKSLYAPERAYGGGMSSSSVRGAMASLGANLEATVPSIALDGTCTEEFMSDTSFRTPQNIKDALIHAGYKSVDISIDMDSIAHAIDEYGAVIVMLEGKNNGTWLSPNPQPPKSTDTGEAWIHWMAFAGAGRPLGYERLKALQSWGMIGDHGCQYFQENYLPYVFEVTAFYKPVVVPQIEISPVGIATTTPIEIPLQSTSTLSVTHPSSFWVSFWTIVLKVINTFIGH